MQGGLTRRVLVASGLLAVIIAGAFAVLLSSVAAQDRLQVKARQSQQVLVVANHLERSIVDLETGQRGFLLTGSADFLQPWQAARAAFPTEAATLERLVADMTPQQEARARWIEHAGTSYLRDYSIPLVEAARRDRSAVNAVTATEEGKQRLDAIRAEFDRLVAAEATMAADRQRRSAAADSRAVAGAVAGLTGSVALVALFASYLARRIVRPVRRVAAMACRLAGGDLGARVQERGTGEVAALQHSFNTMASALEENRQDLAASRARIVAAADRERRRIERDLHDGTQQRLVSLALELRAIEALAPSEEPHLRKQLAEIAQGLGDAQEELRELSRGIHPAILSEGGLGPALKALARRCPVPVELDVAVPDRLSEPVEVAAYFIVSEALANTVKHAHASAVWVKARVEDGHLRLSIRDDGVGGADVGHGSGLIGLMDRVQALDGTLAVISAPGDGTTLQAGLPTVDR
ncbi:CHASE3 domain-containing protein [Streptomyces sp. NPDC048415]|uniref:CHASE3 domain-containing protein n=1 Tax=Streptomyces sp. NPDC048415 TaxID=3154822 RepID=UPI0034134F95